MMALSSTRFARQISVTTHFLTLALGRRHAESSVVFISSNIRCRVVVVFGLNGFSCSSFIFSLTYRYVDVQELSVSDRKVEIGPCSKVTMLSPRFISVTVTTCISAVNQRQGGMAFYFFIKTTPSVFFHDTHHATLSVMSVAAEFVPSCYCYLPRSRTHLQNALHFGQSAKLRALGPEGIQKFHFLNQFVLHTDHIALPYRNSCDQSCNEVTAEVPILKQ